MLKARKIRLDESQARRRHLGDDEKAECRGLYNWWVMKLRAGERWNWKHAKKTLAESRKYDPAIDQVYGKLLEASLLPAGQGHASLLQAGSGWREARIPQGATPASVLYPVLSSGLSAV